MTDAPGTGAASVAGQLLEFLREPARVRPAYLHGQQPLPEGHVVLKFALGRFSHGWQRDLSAHDQREVVEAARAFVRQVCLRERSTHYQALCLDPGADREAIKENYRLLMALLHPDRQDAATHDWPTGCAQRVNEAYAVLSDEARRVDYDQDLQRVHAPPPSFDPHVMAAAHGPSRGHRRPLMRPFLIVTSVVAAIFAMQAWWVSDVPSHYSLLERASPMRTSAQWVRDALPRFMESKPTFAFDPLELLAPSKPPHRLASAALPAPHAPSAAAEPKALEAPPRAAEVARPQPPVLVASAQPVREMAVPALRLAQAPPASPPAASGASMPASAAVPGTQDIEIMVARLVSYYESGDADGLMSLFDPDELGFWNGMRVRNAYSDFFRATRERRLRIDRLTWKTGAASASAQGEATLAADFVDNRGRLERKLEVELEVAMRNGQARLTRLRLYPDTR
jgi:curved DNA-binding protein CbpA